MMNECQTKVAAQKFALCCVIDRHPRFYVELILWTICAKRHLPSEDTFRLIVYFVDSAPDDLLDWLQQRSVETRQTVTIVPGSPHCNKIAPFLDQHPAEFTAVTDSDLFFVANPSRLFTLPRFRAPPNNHCNPPPDIFKALLSASGLERPYRAGMALHKGSKGLRETHINNISAGFVAAPKDRCGLLGQTWTKWANWLVANHPLLDRWTGHIDQVGFALAMEDIGEDVELLPAQTNTILHSLEELVTVYAFHLSTGHIPRFPQRFNSDRTLNTSNVHESVALAISRLNACIKEAIETISILSSTKEHLDKFLNPRWMR